MREIKFRGKRLDNGEWADGFVLFSQDKSEAVIAKLTATESVCENVAPATVGQFTGFRDKNGREIYEGDIVVLRRGVKNISNIQTIEWCSHASAFVRVIDDMDAHFISEADMDLYEVIGNIHDNPELLKTE